MITISPSMGKAKVDEALSAATIDNTPLYGDIFSKKSQIETKINIEKALLKLKFAPKQ